MFYSLTKVKKIGMNKECVNSENGARIHQFPTRKILTCETEKMLTEFIAFSSINAW